MNISSSARTKFRPVYLFGDHARIPFVCAHLGCCYSMLNVISMMNIRVLVLSTAVEWTISLCVARGSPWTRNIYTTYTQSEKLCILTLNNYYQWTAWISMETLIFLSLANFHFHDWDWKKWNPYTGIFLPRIKNHNTAKRSKIHVFSITFFFL